MRPFRIFGDSRLLKGQYPAAEVVGSVGPSMPDEEINGFVRLWVSEGVPFAFREIPMVYEIIRSWLGKRLNVQAKHITLIGSARIGYSLAPHPKYGRPFGPESDLDFSVISESVFAEWAETFWRWKEDFVAGRVQPRTPAEMRYWPANSEEVPRNLEMGFIDGNRIPRRDQYPGAQQLGQAVYLLKKKVDATPEAPAVRRASVRIYRDWSAFLAQVRRNLRHSFGSLRDREV